MSDLESTAVGVVIFVLMLVFVGIWIWAWLPYHKRNFDLLARMPMLDLQSEQGNGAATNAFVTSDKGVVPDEDNR
jgi:cytochrome c oxidase cbb3-type subunit 4